MFCRLLSFCPFCLATMLSVLLRFTDSDYHFSIFKLFFIPSYYTMAKYYNVHPLSIHLYHFGPCWLSLYRLFRFIFSKDFQIFQISNVLLKVYWWGFCFSNVRCRLNYISTWAVIRRTYITMAKRNNDLQNIAQKTNDGATQILLKTGDEPRSFGRIFSCVALATSMVTNHKWENDPRAIQCLVWSSSWAAL